MDSRAEELVEGPRGRRMLFELSRADGLHDALAASVEAARYWQEPDEIDRMLEDPAFEAPLRSVAEQVAGTREAAWLWHPFAPEQFVVSWYARDPDSGRELEPRAVETGAIADELARWRRQAEDSEEQFREFYRSDPRGRMSGAWWALPQFLGVWSSAALGERGPAALHFVEDDMGYERARVWPLRAREGARVLEIGTPEDWAELCRRHPFDVSASRRSDWGWATGRYGRWVLPDWPEVAREWDAVHVTGAGYLRAAGRAIELGDDTATVLAGWEPGVTAWLGDAVEPAGTPVEWVKSAEGWVRAE
jgi:hypothetical protein